MSKLKRVIYQSHLWAQQRNRIMRMAHGVCELCHIRPAVQVHHMSYAKPILDATLIAVCRECHKGLHSPKAANDNQFLLDLRQAPASEAHLVRRNKEPIGVIMTKLPPDDELDAMAPDNDNLDLMKTG